MSNKIAYIYSPELTRLGDIGTYPHGRSSRVHALVDACELLSSSSSSTTGPDVTVADDDAQYGNQRAKIIRPIPATSLDLLRYHDPRFVNQLLGSGFGLGEVGNESGSSASEDSDDIDGFERPRKRTRFDTVEKYGLVDDCAAFPELGCYALAIAGSTLTAARALRTGDHDVVINLEGGRHHAMKAKASGFCYVQDVALGMMALTKPKIEDNDGTTSGTGKTGRRKPRVMYLDLDIHYGDGVAAAFKHPYKYSLPLTARQKSQAKPHVLTLSMHHHSPGFFPSDPSGGLTPSAGGEPFSLSLPLCRGTSDATYSRLIASSVEPVMIAFDPDYIVLLLGMDALTGDGLTKGAGNWTTTGVREVIKRIKKWGRKVLVLGGGGYNIQNSAKGWTAAMCALLDKELPEEIPEHAFWEEYAPNVDFEIIPSLAKDENDEASLLQIEETFQILASRINEIMIDS